jgi:hypothetical protein
MKNREKKEVAKGESVKSPVVLKLVVSAWPEGAKDIGKWGSLGSLLGTLEVEPPKPV